MIQAGSPDAARLAPDAARREGPDRPDSTGAEAASAGRLPPPGRAAPGPTSAPFGSGQP